MLSIRGMGNSRNVVVNQAPMAPAVPWQQAQQIAAIAAAALVPPAVAGPAPGPIANAGVAAAAAGPAS